MPDAVQRGGSSPRPWGTRQRRQPGPAPGRFIPTPVGNASDAPARGRAPPVHPHARGERCKSANTSTPQTGSSPRPWGTRHRSANPPPGLRFIPTPVGNASAMCSPSAPGSVHPHARGERSASTSASVLEAGSSPRPWGTLLAGHGHGEAVRFIPTPVGNAGWVAVPSNALPVHPHARGERSAETFLIARHAGSSPRPWGTRWRWGQSGWACSVHPHARGERQRDLAPHGDGAGSSPRPWGTRDRCIHLFAGWRFIPTPVGNAVSLASSVPVLFGSSPRPWGTHHEQRAPYPDERFIPTPVGNAAGSPAPWRRESVHPHARGERVQVPEPVKLVTGSSPRPWGTHSAPPHGRRDGRFIPTPVGNAPQGQRIALGGPVHPHARGERGLLTADPDAGTGSSPRPWGTRSPRRRAPGGCRFIPTPVGNAHPAQHRPTRAAVHPHARGERSTSARSHRHGIGSSPRPWGTPVALGHRVAQHRFIPTPVGNAPRPPTPCTTSPVHPHARGERGRCDQEDHRADRFIPTPVGNAASGCSVLVSRSVHPHARGERSSSSSPSSSSRGSSPRPWGTRAGPCGGRRRRRFIPTPVGNATRGAVVPLDHAVHPHARGERASEIAPLPADFGSSPRPWGTLPGADHATAASRFIPTPVGNARRRCCSACSSSVHPHARGERGTFSCTQARSSGSSPRPWGTRLNCVNLSAQLRFIPTPVGNAAPHSCHCGMGPVHPHARGEREFRPEPKSIPYGSSPRPWGTLAR